VVFGELNCLLNEHRRKDDVHTLLAVSESKLPKILQTHVGLLDIFRLDPRKIVPDNFNKVARAREMCFLVSQNILEIAINYPFF
jgi:hypothetical protein